MKNMRKATARRRLLASMLLVVMVAMMLCPVALADGEGDLKSYTSGNKDWGSVADSVTEYMLSEKEIKITSLPSSTYTTDGASDVLKFSHKVTYNDVEYHVTENGYEQLKSLAKAKADAKKAQSKVTQVSEGFSVEPDITGANAALAGLTETISLIVGIICVVVMVLMTVLTACDLLYITVPFFREKSDEAVQNRGPGGMVNTSKKTGEAKPRWITDEAFASVRASIESNYARNPLMAYLGKRIWAFIALGIVIYILFTGNITLIVSFIINIISGLMGGIQGLGN